MSSLSSIQERLGAIDQKASAAHARVDRLETGVRDDLKDIKKDLAEVIAWINQAKGWIAAMLCVSSVAGSGMTLLISHFLKS
jgi:hypothetical protein